VSVALKGTLSACTPKHGCGLLAFHLTLYGFLLLLRLSNTIRAPTRHACRTAAILGEDPSITSASKEMPMPVSNHLENIPASAGCPYQQATELAIKGTARELHQCGIGLHGCW
jgi:hypothetical protein